MSLKILLVEDSPTDAALLKASLSTISDAYSLQVLNNGLAMGELINSTNDSHGLPQLVLLALNLPYRSGHELLQDLHANEHWRKVPVIVLSSSSNPDDVTQSYHLSANAYIRKPKSIVQYQKVCQHLLDFWGKTVELPVS